MHDLDRSDLVFESDTFAPRLDDQGGHDTTDELFDDDEQAEMASELLAVADDAELDQFIGSLFSKARRGLAPLARGVTQNLGRYVKGAVKHALPIGARLAGTAIGGPAGAALAGKASPYLGSLLGLELEGLSAEDQELEAAKQLVRMASSAVQHASNALGGSPASVAKQAVVDAARRYAPGLVRGAGDALANRHGLSQGSWYRKGNTIVLVGV